MESSEIDWSLASLDNQLADLAASNSLSSLELDELIQPGVDGFKGPEEDGETEPAEAVEDLRQPAQSEEELIEACQKYFEIQVDEIQLLAIPPSWVTELQETWKEFLRRVGGRQSAGEAIYDAVMEHAPRIVIEDFKAPRTVWTSRFGDGLSSLIAEVSDLESLQRRAEAMGFSHLSLAVTFSKCELFREVIVSVVEQEFGEQFHESCEARKALTVVLNYIAGALLFTHDVYATRVKDIERSWRQANKKQVAHEDFEDDKLEVGHGLGHLGHSLPAVHLTGENVEKEKFHEFRKEAKKRRQGLNVPKTFNEMFLFNSCVMGYKDSEWMDLFLDQLDAIASNVGNLHRLQEECDVLSVVLTKYLNQINYTEFKVVLLATLRSLVKDWNTEMDVAWQWFWDRLEAMLMDRKILQNYDKKLRQAFTALDHKYLQHLRRMLWRGFFETVPAGQEYLKTSETRLYFVADRIFEISLDMYKDPRKVVQDITGVGLMHVGMNIPREYFRPFAAAAARTFQDVIAQDVAASGFAWSISLIGRIMERVTAEGSTVVMKAICLNDEHKLRKAMAVAPRAERALHLLVVSAGGQSTSPLYWSIDSGSLGCARIIIEDLLTIRADRDNYYYGCDALFDVHQDLIHRLCNSAPMLLGPLLDGLVWKSRSTHNGMRRVNYYIKNLLQDKDGRFGKSIEWLVNHRDPQAIAHPASALAVNAVWSGLAVRYFLLGRAFFMVSLCAFMAGQAVYVHHDGTESYVDNLVVAICRCFTYFCSLTFLLFDQIRHLYVDFSLGNIDRDTLVPIPASLRNPKQLCSLMLTCTLVLMIALEPIGWCMGELSNPNSPFEILTTKCPAAERLKNIYSVCAALASLFFWMLLTDLAVFSMRLYALLLVCGVVVMEVMIFLGAIAFLILAFSMALNALDHSIEGFDGVPIWARTLSQIVLETLPTSFNYGLQSNPTVFVLVALFICIVSFFLLNLLVVQLMETYQSHYKDLQGQAQLSRAGILVHIMDQVNHSTWSVFLKSLQLDEPLEFNEGDVGLAGGMQVLENAHASVVTVDRIHRYGGSSSTSAPWPEEKKARSARQERFHRVESLFVKASTDKPVTGFERKAQKKKSLTFSHNALAALSSIAST